MNAAEKYLKNLFAQCSNELNLRNFNQLQNDSIYSVLSGRSILLSAPTGCGKTEAVIAPLLEKIIESDCERGVVKTRVLYICPTKALINDLYNRFKWVKERLRIKLAIKTGDVDDTATGELPCIIFTTPESLDVMISARIDERSDRYLRNIECLKSVRTVVVDEIHQFASEVRGEHLRWLLFRLKRLTARPLQVIGMSATIPEIEKVRRYIEQFGEAPELISYSAQKRDLYFGLRTIKTVEELYEIVVKLRRNIDARKILIFAETRIGCDIIHEKLIKIDPELNCFVHYSTISGEERERTEAEYKFSAQHSICIATSTLELGIDIGDIDAVILYGAPGNISSFIQKIGRGNRRKNTIFALGIIRDFKDDIVNNDLVKFIGILELFFNNQFEHISQTVFYSVIVQQIFSYSKTRGFFLPEEFYELASELRHDKWTISEIIRHLSFTNVISKPLGHIDKYCMSDWMFSKIARREIYGNMASGGTGKIIITGSDNKKIAEVPLEGNDKKIISGAILRIGGKKYAVISSRRIMQNIAAKVEPTVSSREPVNISYNSQGVPTSFSVCNNSLKNSLESIYAKTDIDRATKESIEQILNTFKPHKKLMVKYRLLRDKNYIYYTFAGTIGNYIIACSQDEVEGYDPIRILLNKKIEPVEFDELFIKRLMAANLENFSMIAGKSQFFELLPASMQIDEIYSGIEPELIEFLGKFHLNKFVKIL